MNPLDLARSSLREMEGYSSARSLNSLSKVQLDANERPCGWPQDEDTFEVNRYPQQQDPLLVKAVASLYKVNPTEILITRGADEGIDVLTRSFCRPGKDKILITPPTYGMYAVAAQLQGAAIIEVPLLLRGSAFHLDLPRIQSELSSDATTLKIVYLCNPNNPTGSCFPKTDLQQIAELTKDRALVVIDEAYAEFCDQDSALLWRRDFPNVVVLRTFSKAWGMAGLRCGTLIASPKIIELLKKILAPYPIPICVSQLILKILSEKSILQMNLALQASIQERQRVIHELYELKGKPMGDRTVLEVFPSQTNFILIQFEKPECIMDLMNSNGISLRSRSRDIPGAIRMTIGLPSENSMVIKLLKDGELK